MKAFQVYERDDRRIRLLRNTGQLVASIAFDTSYNPGQSNWAFGQFDNAQLKTIDINVAWFNRAIKEGQQALGRVDGHPGGGRGLLSSCCCRWGCGVALANTACRLSDPAPAGSPLPPTAEETG